MFYSNGRESSNELKQEFIWYMKGRGLKMTSSKNHHVLNLGISMKSGSVPLRLLPNLGE